MPSSVQIIRISCVGPVGTWAAIARAGQSGHGSNGIALAKQMKDAGESVTIKLVHANVFSVRMFLYTR
jgi:hypothetical protein